MAKWKKLAHVVYQCAYHIGWCPKYRYQVLRGNVAKFVEHNIRAQCEWKRAEVLELSVQEDHVHLVVSIPPKVSISELLGILKGKTAIKLLKSYPGMREKPYWGNHFWSRGYCASTIGLDEEKIRRYVKYQEQREKQAEKEQKEFGLF